MSSCGHRFAKIAAIVITVLTIIAGVQRIVSPEAKDVEMKVSLIAWIIFQLVLLVVLIFEWRFPLLFCLVILGLSLIGAFIVVNFAVIMFAITVKNTPSLRVVTDDEALGATVLFELFLGSLLFVNIFHFLCVYYLYRWATMTRVVAAAGIKNGVPHITVHTAHLP